MQRIKQIAPLEFQLSHGCFDEMCKLSVVMKSPKEL